MRFGIMRRRERPGRILSLRGKISAFRKRNWTSGSKEGERFYIEASGIGVDAEEVTGCLCVKNGPGCWG